MKKIILLFFAAILLTAVFSYSLNVFLKEDFIRLSLKTMLIPCFTWSILLLLAWRRLPAGKIFHYQCSAMCAGNVIIVLCSFEEKQFFTQLVVGIQYTYSHQYVAFLPVSKNIENCAAPFSYSVYN